MKKTFIFILANSLLCTLVSCGSEKYKVVFLDSNGNVIQEENVESGKFATFTGETPTKASEGKKHYVFSTWSYDFENLPIYENVTIKPIFETTYNKCTVTFKNFDGTILETQEVDYGSFVTYTKENPVKVVEDEHYKYTFTSWDYNIESQHIVEDLIINAVYQETIYVLADYYDYNDKLIDRQYVLPGENSKFGKEIPEKPYTGEGKKGYKFTGWDNDEKILFEDRTFHPCYELKNYYNVTFKDDTGDVLGVQKIYEGDDAIFNGATPSKDSYMDGHYQISYIFIGWSGGANKITHDCELVAQYRVEKTYIMSNKEKLIEHFTKFGYGEYHSIQTSSNSEIGYSSNYYIVIYSDTYNDMTIEFSCSFAYGDRTGLGDVNVSLLGATGFQATMNIEVSDHYFESISYWNIKYNFLTQDQTVLAKEATYLAAEISINRATEYLEGKGLPYIW